MDEKVAIEPQLQDRSLLAADRVTGETRRIETDDDGNLLVNVIAGTLTPIGTQDVNIVSSAIDVPVEVQNFPAIQTVDGTIDIGNFPAIQVISGTVDIGNFPASQEITQGTDPWTVDGTVSVDNFPAVQVVSAIDLDIRNLSASQDNIRLSDGVDLINITAAGELNVLATAQPGIDIGDVTINNGSGASAVNIQDGGNSLTVDAIDLDIRNLSHTQDSVEIGDGTDFLEINTDGSINVKPVPIGTHGNAWNAATVSSGNNSAVIDCQYVRTISIFGNSSNNLNPMRVQASMDNTNWYTLTTFAISTGNFGTTIDFGARYLRLQSGQGTNFTVTATVAGK